MKKTVSQIHNHLHKNNDSTNINPCQVYNHEYLNNKEAIDGTEHELCDI